MFNIEFYFDPSCPWCWVTSRWLIEVSKQREINIKWRPFSLALKNSELTGNDVTGHLDTHTIAHRVLRLIEAIYKKEEIDRGELYTQFGKAYFLENQLHDDVFIDEVLKRLKLPNEYKKYVDDVQFDGVLKQHMDDAISVVGDDVGVPLIIFENKNGDKQGYFGPVLQGMPDSEEGLKLWDGLSRLATSAHFYELKRSRKGGSKVKTTKRLFPKIK